MGNRYRIDYEAYKEAARLAAAEGAVLLKNDRGALPLRRGDRVSVFGRIQAHYYKSGTGSGGMVNTRYTVGIMDALKAEEGIEINAELEHIYEAWIQENPYVQGLGWGREPWCQEEMPLTEEIVADAAHASDVALVIIGRTAGEDRDASDEPGSYRLTELEEDMLAKVTGAFDRVAVLLNVGNIIDMSWVTKYDPQAVLYCWQGGMEGGNAVCDVLMGRVNPSGKLTDTIAYKIEDYPSDANFGDAERNFYQEDIYVGYRYFETFAKDRVQYPFGYGLSYTSFKESAPVISYDIDGISAQVQVTNTGDLAGKQVIQMYVNPPQGKLGKPLRNLVAFAKTTLLEPGQVQELVLHADDYAFASYDDSGVTGHPYCYVLEAGEYEIYVGTDVRSARKAGSFTVEETMVIARHRQALAPIRAFTRMKATEGPEGLALTYEDAPLRKYHIYDRMRDELPLGISTTGDRGYKLADVYDGRITLEAFVAQMSQERLCEIVRGEGMNSARVTPGTAAAFGGVSDGLNAMGIPAGCCSDGPSGIRMDCGTYAFSLPNGTCLACTFNEELNEALYAFEGAELRKNHIDSLLGPGMNLHRHPLNGRNFEYFSEDPHLTGKMAAAQLRGMAQYGTTGTIKHFAGNNQEFNRRVIDNVISERALREIYLKGFEIAVKEGGAYMIMTTYGALNGIFTAGMYDLNTEILRREWGFDGLVMTDWWADINEEEGEHSIKQTAAMVRAQNDVYMVAQNPDQNSNGDDLEEALAEGRLSLGQLQRSAMNILRVIMRSPVMDRYLDRISEEEKEAAREMEEEDSEGLSVSYLEIQDELIIDGKDMNTSMGSNIVIGLLIDTKAVYGMDLKVKVDGDRLAQVPVTFLANGQYRGTVTMNGTNGEWVTIERELGPLFNPQNFIKMYFAQSGIQIDSIRIYIKESFSHGNTF